jgi:hypothetical protein
MPKSPDLFEELGRITAACLPPLPQAVCERRELAWPWRAWGSLGDLRRPGILAYCVAVKACGPAYGSERLAVAEPTLNFFVPDLESFNRSQAINVTLCEPPGFAALCLRLSHRENGSLRKSPRLSIESLPQSVIDVTDQVGPAAACTASGAACDAACAYAAARSRALPSTPGCSLGYLATSSAARSKSTSTGFPLSRSHRRVP